MVERRKYIAFSYDSFEDKRYIESQTSYDEVLPYFSYIIKLLVYTDIPDWGMRTVHLRDPEENLIELYTPLAMG